MGQDRVTKQLIPDPNLIPRVKQVHLFWTFEIIRLLCSVADCRHSFHIAF